MAMQRGAERGGTVLLDGVVIIAMAIVAVAFGVALNARAGIGTLPAFIAGTALLLVMICSHIAMTRFARDSGDDARLDDFEEALEIIDGDLQRIDKMEDDFARFGQISDKIERLDRTFGSADLGNLVRLTSEVEALQSRLENMRAELEVETRAQRDKLNTDLRSLEMLMKQLSQQLVESDAAGGGQEAFQETYIAELAAREDASGEPLPELASDDGEELEPVRPEPGDTLILDQYGPIDMEDVSEDDDRAALDDIDSNEPLPAATPLSAETEPAPASGGYAPSSGGFYPAAQPESAEHADDASFPEDEFEIEELSLAGIESELETYPEPDEIDEPLDLQADEESEPAPEEADKLDEKAGAERRS